jgi:transketolase
MQIRQPSFENSLKEKSIEVRKNILTMCYRAKSSHVGSALSVTDILVSLYFGVMKNFSNENGDKCILSKGHAAAALYATLSAAGVIKQTVCDSYCNDGTCIADHPSFLVPGVILATGSLGHGLSVCAGISISDRLDKLDRRIFCILGDGECNEGSVWEAAQFISAENLNNITIILDANRFQGLPSGSRILSIDRNRALWKALNFIVEDVDGHNHTALISTLKEKTDHPKVIVAKTIKGKGIDFMENRFEWHYKSMNHDEFTRAIKGLK